MKKRGISERHFNSNTIFPPHQSLVTSFCLAVVRSNFKECKQMPDWPTSETQQRKNYKGPIKGRGRLGTVLVRTLYQCVVFVAPVTLILPVTRTPPVTLVMNSWGSNGMEVSRNDWESCEVHH